MKRITTLIAVFFIAAPAVAWSQADSAPPEVSLDGLEQVEKTRRKEVYVNPEVDWSVYDQLMIDEATVAFRRNWERDQNRNRSSRVTSDDVERIREGAIELFDEVFTKELTEKGGYGIAETAGDNVLRISPHIVDLDVYAPDTRSSATMQRSYTESAGRMTLKLYLYDSVTGDLLAVAGESKEAPRRGYMQWSNTVSNTREFRMMLQGWAKDLREGLEDATGKDM